MFAKTDIQPLINEGAAQEDIAVSIFQAVVDQTITGLACGRVIKGNVAFLGGPLSFLSELRDRFAKTLNLGKEQVIFPENSRFYTAIGAAILSDKQEPVSVDTLIERINKPGGKEAVKEMPPLFETDEDYREFKERHEKTKVPKKDLSKASGPVFLGIDAGSTTTKAALIDKDGCLLYTYYLSLIHI